MNLNKKLKEKFVYNKIENIPVDNPYFTFYMYNISDNNLYLLSDEVKRELDKYNNNYIKWVYYLICSQLEKSINMSKSISELLIPMLGVFISTYYVASMARPYIMAFSIFCYTIYFTLITARFECEQSYYSFYIEKFKYVSEKRKLEL